jgi:hypothetical protein
VTASQDCSALGRNARDRPARQSTDAQASLTIAMTALINTSTTIAICIQIQKGFKTPEPSQG